MQKKNLADFLLLSNSYEVSDNNWRLFPVLVNLALKSLSQPYDQHLIDFGLERLDSYYLGNGWYKDGVTEQRDYYIPFALHFYSLIYAKVCEKSDPERSALYKERAAEFAKTNIIPNLGFWNRNQKRWLLAFGHLD